MGPAGPYDRGKEKNEGRIRATENREGNKCETNSWDGMREDVTARERANGYDRDTSQAMVSDVISSVNRASSHHIITRKMAHYYHYYFIFSALHRGSEITEKQKAHEININKSSEQDGS